ncbi:hypothetical protein [Idiomarina sp.]|jgi:hypothetical protein|uniref:hypothetical protein n=1 Tax=Idiomarina sp. TaxID=1874361 RepID=UPI001D2D0C5E|nr:hypothetical protein [Idiomarina sp.]MCJ8316188.1 hypothetical protein [Idiomarina sp.]NQZ16102.1 hypothetical protein [Idiomarina sp.]
MSDKLSKTEIQLDIFEEALKRLLANEGQVVKPGTKLSMAQLALESGVGSGTLYYKPYKEFREKANKLMDEFNNNPSTQKIANADTNTDIAKKLRAERDSEKELKIKYRGERDELKEQLKVMCADRGAVEHDLYEATARIKELEEMFERATGVHPDQYQPYGNKITVLPRNLQSN